MAVATLRFPMFKTLLRPFQRKNHDDPFQDLVECYRRRIRKYHRHALPVASGARVGVVVSPWQQTAVPFYLIEWAIRLRREGLEVELIWDVWPRERSGEATAEEKAIIGILEEIEAAFAIRVVTPDALAEPSMRSSPRLARLAFETITRNRGREPQIDDPDVVAEEKRLRVHVGNAEKLIAERKYAWILLPGGVWAVSGIYWDVCQTLGVGMTTFDSGPGLLCFQHGGPAAHFPDLNSGMQKLAERCLRDESVRQKIESWVDERLAVRRKGEDDFRLQPQGGAFHGRADIVIPLNYRLDTAAMCRQRLFSSINEWMHALVDWAKAHPDVSIVFRQHPCEKIEAYRSKEDYSWISGTRAPNIHFVDAADPVNTYDLLTDCKLVLPYSSRVGIEAALFGKPVILAASSYYEKMAFAQMAPSREAYFELIESNFKNPPEPTAEQRCSAYAAYYVAESFGLHKTRFTPIPSDFASWVDLDPDLLWSKDRHDVFLKAAISRIPVADFLVETAIAA